MNSVLEQLEIESAREQQEIRALRTTYAEILRRDIEGNAGGDDANRLRKAMQLFKIDADSVKEHRARLAELVAEQAAIPDDATRRDAQEKVAELWRDHNSLVERHRQELAAMNEQIAEAERISRNYSNAIRTAAESENKLRRDFPVAMGLPDTQPEPEKLNVIGPQWDHAIEHDAVQID